MNETKPWYLSRTIWASLVTIVDGRRRHARRCRSPASTMRALTDTLLQAVTAIARPGRDLRARLRREGTDRREQCVEMPPAIVHFAFSAMR